jgi:hypothetical protein
MDLLNAGVVVGAQTNTQSDGDEGFLVYATMT